MVRKLIATMTVFGTLIAFSGIAQASSSFRDGGYSTSSGDSSTCGQDWAQDLNVRNFVVQLPAVSPGVYKVRENFVQGHFSTFKGVSPESCQAGNSNTVKGGVHGTWHGSFSLTVSGTLDVNGTCDTTTVDTNQQCYTAGWVTGFFGPSATYTLDDWAFYYNAKGQDLKAHNWTNACTVADTGAGCTHSGNSGDIASVLAP